jgi:hypothetical protein
MLMNLPSRILSAVDMKVNGQAECVQLYIVLRSPQHDIPPQRDSGVILSLDIGISLEMGTL